MIETATLTCGATIFVAVLVIAYLIELIDKINEGLRRKDTELITKSGEKLVAHIKAKRPRMPMSVEGAMEILAAIGRQLIFMDGVEAVHSLDGDQNDTTGSRN